MTAEKRIEALVEHLHTNIKSFSELCGYERPQAFYDVLKGKTRNISPTMCEKIIATFPSVNRVWLMTGEGEMLNPEAESLEPRPARSSADKMVPLVHLSAFAGPIIAYYESGELLRNCPLVKSPTPLAELAIPVTGDSMEPMIPNGAVLYVSRINERSFIPWGNNLVIVTDNGIFVKRIMPDQHDENCIVAESVNPRYPAMRVPKESIYAMYRILEFSKSYMAM